MVEAYLGRPRADTSTLGSRGSVCGRQLVLRAQKGALFLHHHREKAGTIVTSTRPIGDYACSTIDLDLSHLTRDSFAGKVMNQWVDIHGRKTYYRLRRQLGCYRTVSPSPGPTRSTDQDIAR